MIIEKFKNISIKGRVAYGINCFEKALINYKCTLENWKWILEELWKYTSIEFLDDWFYKIAEFLPDTLLDGNKEYAEDFEYLSEDQFYSLVKIYTIESNPVINEIFRLVFEMGTMDLYSKLEGNAQNSLNCLEKINNIMDQENIDQPSIIPFVKYDYKENNGWGKSFDGKENSFILCRS